MSENDQTQPPTQPFKDQKRVEAFLKKMGRRAQIDPDEIVELVSLDEMVPGAKTLPVRGRRGRAAFDDALFGAATAPTRTLPAAAPRPLATLEAQAVSAWFGSHKVLDRVSLTMPAGQVTALIGPSGCGKSTFLRTLNRMHEQVASAKFAGQVLLDGSDIYDPKTKITEARTHIGMVFQRPNPFPAMSIYDNVVSGLKLEGIRASRDEKDELVEKSLIRAGLWNEVKDRLAQPGGGLSGGQQQRLCIARALAVNPRVLLMDEPCSALDPTSTRVIEETMVELQREVTIVIVTHNMQQAQRVSQQCAFFLASQGTPGAIVEFGDTEAMFGDPQDGRTRDYVNGRFG
jgi:phosphate transport system ATP-binding protein